MANIRVFAVSQLPTQGGDVSPVYPQFWRSQQEVAIGGTSTQSEAMSLNNADGTYPAFVIIQADAACHVALGMDPTATTADFKIQAGETVPFSIMRNGKVAVIQA